MQEFDHGGFLVHWQEIRELRKLIKDQGLPADPQDPRNRFVAMVANAEGLRVLFGGQVDQGAVDEAYALVETIKAIYAWEHEATHQAPATRQ